LLAQERAALKPLEASYQRAQQACAEEQRALQQVRGRKGKVAAEVASLSRAAAEAEGERALLQEELPQLEAERAALSRAFESLNAAAAQGAEALVARLTLANTERRKAEVRPTPSPPFSTRHQRHLFKVAESIHLHTLTSQNAKTQSLTSISPTRLLRSSPIPLTLALPSFPCVGVFCTCILKKGEFGSGRARGGAVLFVGGAGRVPSRRHSRRRLAGRPPRRHEPRSRRRAGKHTHFELLQTRHTRARNLARASTF
jgi:hypothetical protein